MKTPTLYTTQHGCKGTHSGLNAKHGEEKKNNRKTKRNQQQYGFIQHIPQLNHAFPNLDKTERNGEGEETRERREGKRERE